MGVDDVRAESLDQWKPADGECKRIKRLGLKQREAEYRHAVNGFEGRQTGIAACHHPDLDASLFKEWSQSGYLPLRAAQERKIILCDHDNSNGTRLVGNHQASDFDGSLSCPLESGPYIVRNV